MKLWLLQRTDTVGWDEADGFVVRAMTEDHARFLAAQEAGGEGEDTWRASLKSSCVELSAKGPPNIILRDFKAG